MCEFPADMDICVFQALTLQLTKDMEEDPRFTRILNRFAFHENIEDGMAFWRRKTGRRNAFMFKKPNGDVVTEADLEKDANEDTNDDTNADTNPDTNTHTNVDKTEHI
jgi:hypothetical protein